MNPFSVNCPSCDSSLKIKKESLVGKKVRCPKCGKGLLIKPPEQDEFVDDFDEIPTQGQGIDFSPGNGKKGRRSQKSAKTNRAKNSPAKARQPSPSSNKKVMAIVGGGVALLAIAAVGYFIMQSEEGGDANNMVAGEQNAHLAGATSEDTPSVPTVPVTEFDFSIYTCEVPKEWEVPNPLASWRATCPAGFAETEEQSFLIVERVDPNNNEHLSKSKEKINSKEYCEKRVGWLNGNSPENTTQPTIAGVKAMRVHAPDERTQLHYLIPILDDVVLEVQSYGKREDVASLIPYFDNVVKSIERTNLKLEPISGKVKNMVWGSIVIEGEETKFTSELSVGQKIHIDHVNYIINEISSDTVLRPTKIVQSTVTNISDKPIYKVVEEK